jgi:hypothetical protein
MCKKFSSQLLFRFSFFIVESFLLKMEKFIELRINHIVDNTIKLHNKSSIVR